MAEVSYLGFQIPFNMMTYINTKKKQKKQIMSFVQCSELSSVCSQSIYELPRLLSVTVQDRTGNGGQTPLMRRKSRSESTQEDTGHYWIRSSWLVQTLVSCSFGQNPFWLIRQIVSIPHLAMIHFKWVWKW